jgi:hypothetical protein
VFSLQARRALFHSLDLIPPGLTPEASPGAVDAARLDCPSVPDHRTQQPALSSKKHHLAPKHQQHSVWNSGKRRKRAAASSNSQGLLASGSDTSTDGGEGPEAAAPAERSMKLPATSERYCRSSSSAEDDSAPATYDQDSHLPHSAGGRPTGQKRADSVLPTAGAPLATFVGACWVSGSNMYCFHIGILGASLVLGMYKPEDAESGARLYDALQLLLHGPRANTTYLWKTYTQANVAAAAEVLQSKVVGVHQAVVHAREGRAAGQWIGVSCNRARAATWNAHLVLYTTGSPKLNIRWGVQQSAEEAARQADCGLLAIKGLRCTTNFPASRYRQQQLVAAGEHAISKGVDAGLVQGNLEAVQQVR